MPGYLGVCSQVSWHPDSLHASRWCIDKDKASAPPPKAQPGCTVLGDSFFVPLVVGRLGEHAAGAAKRRRERRLRQWQRHERMTVAMALAEATHHSAPRSQNTPHAGARPGILAEPGPQRSDRSLWRSVDDLPTLSLPVLAGASGESTDASSLRFLTGAARDQSLQRAKALKEAMERDNKLRRKRKKRRKKRLPRTSSLRRTRLHGARAKATDSHCSSSCSSCARGKQVLQPFTAALEATPVSAQWYDFSGGVMSSAVCGSLGTRFQVLSVSVTGFYSSAPIPHWDVCTAGLWVRVVIVVVLASLVAENTVTLFRLLRGTLLVMSTVMPSWTSREQLSLCSGFHVALFVMGATMDGTAHTGFMSSYVHFRADWTTCNSLSLLKAVSS